MTDIKSNSYRSRSISGDHSRYTKGRRKMLWRWKEETKKPDIVTIINSQGMTTEQAEVTINIDTHSKIVVTNETIAALIDFAKKGDRYALLVDVTFDDIIQSLLKRYQKQQQSSKQ